MASAPSSPTLLRPPSFHPATVEWAPGAQPRYVVINPMHIITLQDKTKTFAVRVVEKIKSFSERWFSHILLLIFLLIYACLGALLFQWLEAPAEEDEKSDIIRTREMVIEKLWQKMNESSEEDWNKFAHRRLKEYEEQVEQHFRSKTAPDSEKKVWTFWGALFYAGTVFTTIGYGNITPATTEGRAATIIYAFIGIPFLLMVLADLGRLFTRAIKAVFYYAKLFYQTGKIKKARKMGRRATAVPVQYMTVAWNKMPYFIYQNRDKRGSLESPSADVARSAQQNEILMGKAEPADDIKKDQEPLEQADETNQDIDAVKDIGLEDVDDEFNLPVSMAIFLLIAYMMLGAGMFYSWEKNWSFFESFYFVFISMSTIGFGDFVPDHPIFMMAAFIYLLFGLALTSMCINVIQEKLSATFEMAKLRIGATIGLDANMIMEKGLKEKSESPERKDDATVSKTSISPVPDSEKEDSKKENEQNSEVKTNGIADSAPSKGTESLLLNS